MNIPSTNSVSGSSASAQSFQRAARKEEPAQFPGAGSLGSEPAAETPAADGANNGKRLRAYAEKIETRLQNALASRDLTPRQRVAIETQSKKFHALLKRLQGAFLPGNGSDGGAGLKDMHSVLDRLNSSLNDVLSGAQPMSPKSSTKPVDAPPAAARGGLDTIA